MKKKNRTLIEISDAISAAPRKGDLTGGELLMEVMWTKALNGDRECIKLLWNRDLAKSQDIPKEELNVVLRKALDKLPDGGGEGGSPSIPA